MKDAILIVIGGFVGAVIQILLEARLKKTSFLKELNTDDAGTDKLEDSKPANTYQELYLIYIGAILTIIAVVLLVR